MAGLLCQPLREGECEAQGIFEHRENPTTRIVWYHVLRADGTTTWESDRNLEGGKTRRGQQVIASY